MKEIEEKFFKTFNIQPSAKCSEVFPTANVDYEVNIKYPEITDTTFLKLICVCS